MDKLEYSAEMMAENLKLEKENEKLKRENNDLRRIYRNTYQKLFNNGNDELARYFQAQIDECPTFYVEPIVDYYNQCNIYERRMSKVCGILESICFASERSLTIDECNRIYTILKGGRDE